MNAKVYRIGVFVSVLGIVGLFFFTYAILHTAGIVPWKVFPRMRNFNLVDDPDAIRLFAILDVGCLLLVWTVRLKVTLDETGILYRGLLHSVRMRWADITRVNNHLRGRSIHLWANQRHLEIPTMFFRLSDLRDTITKQVMQNNSDAIVENSPLPFWPRRHKR